MTLDRRQLLALTAAGTAGLFAPFLRTAQAQAAPLKLGVMLPYSGAYAALGEAITHGMELYVQLRGGQLAGRNVQFIKLDDESAPPKASELTNKLVFGEKVDVLLGTVHSGVALAMVKIAREEGIPTIIPNAGADALTRGLCAANVFRTSFSNSQTGYATGEAMARAGHKRAVSLTWKYVAGDESVAGFRRAFLKGGGQVVKEIAIPFPDVEFQSALAEISTLTPDAVYGFFSGGASLKLLREYAAAGLNKNIQLWGPGFLTDGIETSVGAAAEGLKTVSHYVDSLDNPANKAFVAAFTQAYSIAPDVYAVQGWDAMQLLDAGLMAVSGDTTRRKEMTAAMAKARFDSPRGPFRLSSSHNPIQNYYLREFRGGITRMQGISSPDLADETTGCKLT